MSLGVLGGIGPESTGDFYLELIEFFQKEFQPTDNTEYPHILVNSIPARDLISCSQNQDAVLADYRNGLKDLEAWTADVAIVACNSAYCFFDEITRDLAIPVIHARQTVEDALTDISAEKICVLASPTTSEHQLYVFPQFSQMALSVDEQERLGLIIKRMNIGKETADDELFVGHIARRALREGAVVIAGCTEIHKILKKNDISHINPMTEMARAMIHIWVAMKQWKRIPSIIHGTGIASRVFIEKGAVAYKIAFAKKSSTFRPHWAYIHGTWYADGGAFDWLNHSCDPNVEIVVIDGIPGLRALRDISPNEEVTCDYSVTEGSDGKKIPCTCHARNCRGTFEIKV